MGIVEEVGAEVTHIKPGDRVVVPFNISCGSCWMCSRGLLRPVRDHPGARAGQGRGAVRLHLAVRLGARRPGRVPPGAAGPLRPDQGARRAHRRALPLPLRHPAHRLAGRRRTPTCRRGGTLAVLGLGPVGQFCARIGRHLGAERVIGVDLVPERLAMAARARRRGRSTCDEVDDVAARADRADRRPRPGRRHRRRRHGGARLAARQGRPGRGRACCRTRWPSR